MPSAPLDTPGAGEHPPLDTPGTRDPLDPAAPDPPPMRSLGTGEPLDRAALEQAPLRSLPHPSRLRRRLEVRPARAARGAQLLGLHTVGDLLEHLPHRHEDRREARAVADLHAGEDATVIVEVKSIRHRPIRRRGLTLVEATVADDSGPTKALWWNQAWVVDRLPPGTRAILHGRCKRRGEFHVSDYEAAAGASPSADHQSAGLVPVYPANEHIPARKLRELAWALRGAEHDVLEPLPAALRRRENLAERSASLAAVHFPEHDSDDAAGRRRLAFEQLLLRQLALVMRRARRDAEAAAPALSQRGQITEPWLREGLPFALTEDQRRAIEVIDSDLSGARPMQRLLMGEVGSGKAQPLDSSVLTPFGFRPMGEIEVGDEVINPTGERTRVVGVFPQGERDVWRVKFSDDTSVECDADHLWQVQTSGARSRGDAPKVKTTREIAADLKNPSGSAKWHLELIRSPELDSGDDRPLDPYLLGLLLGDGGLSRRDRVGFTSADGELIDAVRRALPPGCVMRREHHRPYDWKIVGQWPRVREEVLATARRGDGPSLARAYEAGASHEAIASRVGLRATTVRYHVLKAGVRSRPSHRPPTRLAAALEGLGLMGASACDKKVPNSYLAAPIKDRHALLQGLLDTDGTLGRKTGADVSFTSTSHRLAEDVAWLVRSLGGRARCRTRRREGTRWWHTSVILPAEFPPFRLLRKAELLRVRTKYGHPARAIVAIEPAGRKSMQCIAVAHPNHLYVTDHFTVTHNTVVALHAMLRAVEHDMQAALMAPTETLADQHFATLQALMGGQAIPMALLTGATPAVRRADVLGKLASGELSLVVGTHALIESDVGFARLAVAVVDEQHRFGVRQRQALDRKGPEGLSPHVLHMTATPIPRTLALTQYGDLDVTALRELPAGRRAIETHVAGGERERARAYERMREELRAGRQAFVVCPLVSESEALAARAATAEYERLAAGEFRDFRVVLLHGQMRPREKQAAMIAFAAGDADVLVATSVIEVGIDVPNATVMLVEDAERYGISQLHQLRGRVGRGEHASLCLLFGPRESPRLRALADSTDGFRLAEVDLRLRGEGELVGTRQSGLAELDVELLESAHRHAQTILERDPTLRQPEHVLLADALRGAFGPDASEPLAA